MAKTLVYEGCPACAGVEGYGQIAMTFPSREVVMNMVQGGAIGAGAATAIDFLIPRIPVINRLPVTIRPLLNGGLSVLAASLLYRRNPSLAVGIGLGGSAVAIYKFLATVVGKVASVPVSGFGEEGMGYGEETEEEPVEIETTAGQIGETGVVVPVEEMAGYGEEEILIE